MTNDRCEWCEAPAVGNAPNGGGERLCAECFAACVPDDVDKGDDDAADHAMTRAKLRALQFVARSGDLVMPFGTFGRETMRARMRPRAGRAR